MDSDYCRKIIILGKTGSGKSSLGNSLLGTNAFEVGHNFYVVTERCQKRSENNICVVDTPGLLCAENNVAQTALEILSSLNICPKPHAFIIVFSALARTGHDELRTISLLRLIFTEKILNHAIVVFTGYDEKATDSDFDKFWRGNDIIREFVEACGGRVARIDNNSESSDLFRRVGEILQRVDILCENGQKQFDCTYGSVNENALQEIQRENAKLAKKITNQQHSIETFEQEVEQIRIALSRDYYSRFKRATWKHNRKMAIILFGIGCVAAGAIVIKTGEEKPGLDGVSDAVSDAVSSAVSSEGTASWMSSALGIVNELNVYLTNVTQSVFGNEENLIRHIEHFMTVLWEI